MIMRNFSTDELKHQTKHIYLNTYLKGTTSESDLTTEVKMIFYLHDRIISSGKKRAEGWIIYLISRTTELRLSFYLLQYFK